MIMLEFYEAYTYKINSISQAQATSKKSIGFPRVLVVPSTATLAETQHKIYQFIHTLVNPEEEEIAEGDELVSRFGDACPGTCSGTKRDNDLFTAYLVNLRRKAGYYTSIVPCDW
jgi:hypothetical protein